MTEHGVELVRWYTRARRFPQLIARTPDGTKLPGGPYSIHQVVAAGVLLVVGFNTMGMWARFGFMTNVVVLLGVTWLVVYGIGRIPLGARNPISVATGVVQAITASGSGRYAGRPVRLPRPTRVQQRVLIPTTTAAWPAAPQVSDQPRPRPDPQPIPAASSPPPRKPQPVAVGAPAPTLTAVQQLLAARTSKESS